MWGGGHPARCIRSNAYPHVPGKGFPVDAIPRGSALRVRVAARELFRAQVGSFGRRVDDPEVLPVYPQSHPGRPALQGVCPWASRLIAPVHEAIPLETRLEVVAQRIEQEV